MNDISARLDRCERLATATGSMTAELRAEIAALRAEIAEMSATPLKAVAAEHPRRVTDLFHPAAGGGPEAS